MYSCTVCTSRQLTVTNLSFTPEGTVVKNKNLTSKQSALKEALKPLFSSAFEYENIRMRDITELATAKDIPRLVWGIHILSSEGKNVSTSIINSLCDLHQCI